MTGRRARFQAGDIVYGYLRPYLNKVWIAEFDGICSVDQYVFKVRPTADRNYVYHFLRSAEFLKTAPIDTAPGQLPRIRSGEISATPIPLPPLSEQKRIAAILDKADQLRQKRRQAIALLDSLTQSIFLEMFGDLVSNPKRWQTLRFADCVTIDAPLVDPRLPQYRNLLHYGPDRIEKDNGRLLPAQTALEDNLISKKFLCDKRHILYSKIRPYLNKVALSPGDCLCSADMYPIEPKDTVVDQFYLWFILRSRLFLSYAEGCSGRANIPKINRDQLLNFEMPRPDFALQSEFRYRIESLEENRSERESSLSGMEHLFSSLQHRAFSGQL
ncbi:restriction endonuclease subunit S [Rhizobium ruizarguesonis]